MRLHGYLMGSITFQASPDQLVVGSAMIYAAQRQFGGVIVPKQAKALAFQWGPEGIRLAKSVTQPGRAFIGISDEDREDITAAFHDYITGA
jgi:phage gpG-like protein